MKQEFEFNTAEVRRILSDHVRDNFLVSTDYNIEGEIDVHLNYNTATITITYTQAPEEPEVKIESAPVQASTNYPSPEDI